MKDVGVLFDLAAINPRYGGLDSKILLRSRCAPIRVLYGGIHLALLDCSYRYCPRRYLDGKFYFITLNFEFLWHNRLYHERLLCPCAEGGRIALI